jgi:hypothetical protein
LERNGKGYQLTNDDSNLPDHYGWKNSTRLELIKNAYRAKMSGRPLDEVLGPATVDGAMVAKLLGELDASGLWITTHDGSEERLVGQPKFGEGEKYLSSERFSENLRALSGYVKGLSR